MSRGSKSSMTSWTGQIPVHDPHVKQGLIASKPIFSATSSLKSGSSVLRRMSFMSMSWLKGGFRCQQGGVGWTPPRRKPPRPTWLFKIPLNPPLQRGTLNTDRVWSVIPTWSGIQLFIPGFPLPRGWRNWNIFFTLCSKKTAQFSYLQAYPTPRVSFSQVSWRKQSHHQN